MKIISMILLALICLPVSALAENESVIMGPYNVSFDLAGAKNMISYYIEPVHESISEDLPLDPVTPYGISKLGTEKIANHYIVNHHMKIVIARIFIHIGVGGTDSLAVNQFCRQIALAEEGFLCHEGTIQILSPI